MKKQTGFTIVELLIVIVVIGILAAITVVAYNGIQERARDTQRITDIAAIGRALQLWSIDSGKSFEVMNEGYHDAGATGYYNGNYGGESVQKVLSDAGFLPENIQGIAGHRYMLTRCTNASDNRRVVMTGLEDAPEQTVAEQLQGTGCNNTTIDHFISSYGMNYAIVVGG